MLAHTSASGRLDLGRESYQLALAPCSDGDAHGSTYLAVLLTTTRRTLANRLRVDRTDVDSILRLVRSRLEVSIRAALAAEDT